MFVNPRVRIQSTRAVTLLELIFVMAIVGIVFAVTQALLARTIESWWKVNANADAQQQLYKAQNFLERDLRSAAFETEAGRETLAIQSPATSTELNSLAGADGDVFWFLSAIDPVSGEFQRRQSGAPLWQRNILYYAVTPMGLAGLDYFGAGQDVAGYESACPFKVLIRKEIDHGVPTLAGGPESNMENLMTPLEVLPYLNRPNGYDTSGMAAPGVTVRPVCGNLLTFRVSLDAATRGVALDIRATALERAKREGGINDRDLSTNPATQQLNLMLFPPNRQGPPIPVAP